MRVGVLTKAELDMATTRWAQGGVAAVLGGADPDSTDLHLADTLAAGDGLCDVDAVRVLVDEGPDRVHELIALGAVFDVDASSGELALAREGGHSVARIVHAGGAATGHGDRAGPRRRRAPDGGDACSSAPSPSTSSSRAGAASGVRALDGRRQRRSRCAAATCCWPPAAPASSTPSPPTRSRPPATAWPWRCGPAWPCADVEFVQFHPTALHHPPMPRPLLSEALRGHGALLRDTNGERFVDELLPRDKVSRAITERMHELGVEHVLLDATGLDGVRRPLPDHRRRPRRASASTRPPTGCRSRRPRTTAAAASSPTSTAPRRCPACGPPARWRATASWAPTAWRRTRCSTAWCSPRAPSRPSTRGVDGPEPTGAMRAVLDSAPRRVPA